MAGHRGRVYVCPEPSCAWKGEKWLCLGHYSKKHCTPETAPFGCVTCPHMTDSFENLERHRETEQHKALGEDDEHHLRRNSNEGEIVKKFTMLSAEESQEYWRKKREKTQSPAPRGRQPQKTKQKVPMATSTDTTTKSTEKQEKTQSPDPRGRQPQKSKQEIPTATSTDTTKKSDKDSSPVEDELQKAVESILPEPQKKRDSSNSSSSSSSSNSSRSSSSSSSSASSKPSPKPPVRKVILTEPHSKQKRSAASKRARDSSEEPDYTDWKRRQKTFDITKTAQNKTEVRDTPTNSDVMAAVRDLRDSVQDNPAVLSAGLLGVSQQLKTQTNESIQVSEKLDVIIESLGDIKKLLGTLVQHHSDDKREMTTIRQAICVEQNTMTDHTTSVNSLATSVRTLAPRMEAMMGTVSTALTTFAAAHTAQTVTKERESTMSNHTSSIDGARQQREFERDWERVQGDRDRNRDRPIFRRPNIPPRNNNNRHKDFGRKSVERSLTTLRRSKDRR